jgi:hypothetical protein
LTERFFFKLNETFKTGLQWEEQWFHHHGARIVEEDEDDDDEDYEDYLNIEPEPGMHIPADGIIAKGNKKHMGFPQKHHSYV